MLKSDLVNVLIQRARISQRQAEEAVDHIFDSLRNALVHGDDIEIRGLGSFRVKSYDGYTGRNPKTHKAIPVKPKRGVLFRTGKELRDRMNVELPAEESPTKKADANDPTEHAA
jgi:integration host factor subunit beta